MARTPSKKHLVEMQGAMEYANKKFARFDKLNAAIDAKVNDTMTQSEKMKLAADRDAARRGKAKIVTQQAFMIKEPKLNTDDYLLKDGKIVTRGRECKRVSPHDVRRMQSK